ncbi:MAG: cobalamin-dependent protein [Acidimicrobiales bacterium]|nr:cobalamin-dependent protein [Acidimicrobiales bacterium]
MRHRPLIHLVNPRLDGPGIHHTFFHRFPPMALLVLSAIAKRAGWETRLVDENHEPIPDEAPDLAAITVWTPVAPRSYALGDHYRSRGVPVVMGGVHASLMPEEALLHADAVVAGEAEQVFEDVLQDVVAGRLRRYYFGEWAGMEHVPRVDDFVHTYERIPFGRYQPTHSMQTTRGCRFNCEFCSVIRINGRGQRHMEPERVVEEISFRTRMKPRLPGPIWILFLDDDLAADLDYTEDLFATLARAKLPIRWGGQASIGLARHPELLQLAYSGGCRQMFTGFESVSREALVECNKKNRPSEYEELIGNYHKAKIYVEGGFIFGFDHDRLDVFDHTAEFVDRIGVDVAHFSILTPLPGTNTFARFYDQGRMVDFDWSHYNFYYPVFEPANMTRQQLIEGQRRAFARYYSTSTRWKRVVRYLRHTRCFEFTPAVALVNRSFAREFRRDLQDVQRPQYRPPQELIEKVVKASRADAPDALQVAGAQLSDPVFMPRRRIPVRVAAGALK